jgi:hypothetical protein
MARVEPQRRRQAPLLFACVAVGALAGQPARAGDVNLALEAATGEVRRGLDWSGGKATASAEVYANVAGVDASVRVAALRASPRFARAEAVADLRIAKEWPLGGVFVRAEAIGHAFVGADRRMDFAEAGIGVRYALGPLEIDGRAYYAPSQSSIGGSNVHVRAGAYAAIPGTPVTLSASLGRSSGSRQGLEPNRLRPAGAYTDWKLGAEVSRGRWSAGVDYVGTSASLAVDDLDDRVVARISYRF